MKLEWLHVSSLKQSGTHQILTRFSGASHILSLGFTLNAS